MRAGEVSSNPEQLLSRDARLETVSAHAGPRSDTVTEQIPNFEQEEERSQVQPAVSTAVTTPRTCNSVSEYNAGKTLTHRV